MEIYSSALKNYRKHGSFVADLEQVQELICHYTIKKRIGIVGVRKSYTTIKLYIK